MQDNDAIGTPVTLEPGSLISGNTMGWLLVAVPAVPLAALFVAALTMLGTGRWALRAPSR